ncbi:GNAT superfamily N-acetyltransferase [Allocatelliglobosispora scoriae]|uniref:GNAT superfamily N-acetyltransferase n=1 Tax=Allocatelliglobosispora scoriae TaxID=643052 RepID=A0A841BY69_9ACTN|nr:GNAT family N-acetyltransferase [Allocatelliglobosispora scoriae]MBB5872496.1 GNAT superfamily N-acetyltransferase [Allocatelliglobosispora scoriae]
MALWRVRATVDDRPGYLSVLTASLALKSVNILAVQVHTTEAGAVDDFLVDAPERFTEADLIAAVERGRGRDAWVARTDAHGLVDPPTQALGQAARLVSDPDELGSLLTNQLDCAISWRPAHAQQGFSDNEMTLADPRGGALRLMRLTPPFTPAEFARAQALVEVANAVVLNKAAQAQLLLPDGTELVIRIATSNDLDAIEAMHKRCSAESRYRRYLSASRGPSRAQLARLLDAPRGATLVAERGEEIIAVANLVGEGAIAEVALLVEDAWQRRAIGTTLLRRVRALAEPAGYEAIMLHTHSDNGPLLRTIRRLGQDGLYDRDGSLVTVTLALAKRAPVTVRP